MPTVALICDYKEERWPSMDLVADMLYENLRIMGSETDLQVAQIRPGMPKLPEALRSRMDLVQPLERVLGRFYHYPRFLRARSKNFALFHILDHSYAQLIHHLPAERTVVTCHDLDTFRCILEPARDPRPFWFRRMARIILDGFCKASAILCVSQTIRRELISHNLVPAERIHVVYNGVDPLFSPASDPEADNEIERHLTQMGGKSQFLFHVGSTITRKNIPGLLRIFRLVQEQSPGAWLVRAGGPLSPEQTQMAQELGVHSRILTLPFLDRRLLAAMYRRARLLVLPSLAEGFGLPLAEAMASGCPVVASDLDVFHEVGGSVVDYVNPQDEERWAERILAALQTGGTVEKKELTSWAARFSWTESARQCSAIYQQILG